MWNWFNCYLSGRHEYGMWCEPGTIFLRCVHCGRRSPGWAVGAKPHAHLVPSPAVRTQPATRSRVVPFDRAAAAR
jgi:hypothetical protein